MAFSIRVVRLGAPARGVRVALSFGAVHGGMTQPKSTDVEGKVQFNHYPDGHVEVYLDTQSYGWYRYEDGKTVTIPLDGGGDDGEYED